MSKALLFSFGFVIGAWANNMDTVYSQIKRTGILSPLFYDGTFKCLEVKDE